MPLLHVVWHLRIRDSKVFRLPRSCTKRIEKRAQKDRIGNKDLLHWQLLDTSHQRPSWTIVVLSKCRCTCQPHFGLNLLHYLQPEVEYKRRTDTKAVGLGCKFFLLRLVLSWGKIIWIFKNHWQGKRTSRRISSNDPSKTANLKQIEGWETRESQ